MTNPVEYLKEAHHRAERLAQAATPGPWLVDSTVYAEKVYSAGNTDVVAGGRWGGEASVFESTEDALHIAANAPDTVLARVTAERAILAEHEPTWASGEPEYDHHHETAIGEHGRTHYIEVRDDKPTPPYWCACCSTGAPCRTLLALAAGWGWTEET